MQALVHFLTLIFRCAPALFRSRIEQATVELALRQQLATLSQKKPKPKITPLDRVFWVALFRFWPRWKQVLIVVKPDTVVRWHRKGFRLYWRWISKRGPGRPPISPEVQALIKAFALDNGWGARKVHAELGKLGFTISLATVSRYMPRRPVGSQNRSAPESLSISFRRSTSLGNGKSPTIPPRTDIENAQLGRVRESWLQFNRPSSATMNFPVFSLPNRDPSEISCSQTPFTP